MSLAMSRDERERFLSDVHVGVMGVEQAEHPPLCVPVWYDFAPETGLWIITGASTLKGRLLSAAGRFSLVAQTEEPPMYRYVSVEGPVVEQRPADLERDRRPMAHRYFGPELGDLYVRNNPGDDEVVFVMRPERWRTVDYSKLG